MKIMKELNHEKFIKVRDIFYSDNAYYIVIDLLKGKSLENLMEK